MTVKVVAVFTVTAFFLLDFTRNIFFKKLSLYILIVYKKRYFW